MRKVILEQKGMIEGLSKKETEKPTTYRGPSGSS
jgi:hypothetical protein